jgi:hypothetical protein
MAAAVLGWLAPAFLFDKDNTSEIILSIAGLAAGI